jgi:hypothetical protein
MPKKIAKKEMVLAGTGQSYAMVKKLYGDGKFSVELYEPTMRGKEALGHMRGSVSRETKQKGFGAGSVVLVSSRDYATHPWLKVDLAYIYTPVEVERLKKLDAANLALPKDACGDLFEVAEVDFESI